MIEKNESRKRKLLLPIVLVVIGLILVIGSIVWAVYEKDTTNDEVNSFESCKDAGGRIGESYPEQCFIDDKSFTNPDHNQTLTDYEIEYIGMTEAEARSKAANEGRSARVVERNGEALPVTMDLVDGRLNFSVRDDRVYKIHTEGTAE